jgi:cobalamin biosynthesis Mg chelatase CobN
VITTVLAAGGANAAGAPDGDWDAGVLATLDVPLLQGLCLTSSRSQWAQSTAALAPIDAAMQVAIPEFDGRLITVPFSFKEEGPDGIGVYQPTRSGPPGWPGSRSGTPACAGSRTTPSASCIMLSSYPTKHARIGNAVGLDTPASAVRLLRAMRDAGYDLGDGFPEDGDDADPRADRGRRPRHGMAHRRSAPRRRRQDPAGNLPPLFRPGSRTSWPARIHRTGASPPVSSTPTSGRRYRARLRCGSATWS